MRQYWSTSVNEAVAVFHDAEALTAAIADLMGAGFAQADLSLMASAQAVSASLSDVFRPLSHEEPQPSCLPIAFINQFGRDSDYRGAIHELRYLPVATGEGAPIVASGGALAAIMAGTIATGSSSRLLSAILQKWLSREDAAYLKKSLEEGGILLWVRTWTSEQETAALDILRQDGGDHPGLHNLPSESSTKAFSSIALN